MNNISDEEYKEETKEENSDVTDIIGYWGKWQLLYFAILLFLSFPAGWFNFSRIFMAPNIDYWCAKPAEFVNMTTEEWKNFSIPLELIESKQVYSKCEMYSLSSGKNRTRISCTSWEYDHSFYTSTITEKWDLVCDRAWIASFAQLMYFVGFLISVFIGGQLSDKFGRKPMFYLTSAWTFIFSMISIFTSSVWLFVACRFLLALGRPNTTQIIYVHATEIVRKEYRIAVGLTCKLGYIIGQFVLPGLVWIFRDWFYIEIIYVLPCLICLPLWWVTSESPRWLITQGKINEAEKVNLTIFHLIELLLTMRWTTRKQT
ncbi:solute carrier family 22 member 5-like isoform X1 [Centruroides sculpturatus]|uniref:solute carrier family 22 member 5-like isoform X1 n=2 Tax=Centruroides sculpturatus TaxID=218467 RepID=UPI000C6CBEA4|nr:solute carrier family 22 member 5-like isoform X1 [Centruroides sculpturatus]